jgi:hypothetical protein
MDNINEQVAFYQNCNFDDLRVRGSGPGAGLIWPNIENILKSYKIFFSHPIYTSIEVKLNALL